MSAAFAGTCSHGTERMTGSAPGPAKVATRMVLLRMGLLRAPKSYPVNLSETLPSKLRHDPVSYLSGDAARMEKTRSGKRSLAGGPNCRITRQQIPAPCG